MTLIDKAEALAAIEAWFAETKSFAPPSLLEAIAALPARGVGVRLHDLPDGVLMAAMMAVEEMDHQFNWFQHWGGDVSGWKDDADPEIRGRYADALERVAQFRRILAALPARGVGEQAAFVRGMEAALDMIRSMRASEGVVIGRDLICTALEVAVTKNRAALAPTDAPHVNETPKSEHDAGNVLTAAQAREAALRVAIKACKAVADELREENDAEAVGALQCALRLVALIGEART